MPKQFNLKINQFDKGLITEASPLNFPEGASVGESNMPIAPDGTRERRLGLQFEDSYALSSLGYTEKELEDAVISYIDWDNVMNNPSIRIGCVVVRERIFFFDLNVPNPSAARLNRGQYITIQPGGNSKVHGAYVNGLLVLTSSALEYPVYLEYDLGQDLVSVTDIKLKIRDLQGVDDGLPLRERPTTLSLEHKYNLINQGWTNSIETVPDGTSEIQFIEAFRGVGGTSGNVTWGGVTWWQDEHNDDIPIGAVNNKIFRGCKYPATAARVGSQLHITFDPRDGARPQYDFELGRCLWNGCAIYSGRIQAGTTTSYGDVHSYLRTKLGVYASNCDIVSLGLVPDGDSLYYNKFSIDTFQKNTGYLNLGEAPKGHIIIDAKNRNTSRNSTVPGVASDYDTGSVSVCCGHAGRVFYAGVQGETINPDARTINSHSLVYFTQIITDKTKLERCYQENDPTDQRQFELAAGDGGTIFIPGCANVIALKSYGTSVLVFSEVGIWEITGGDLPFAATGYSVNKVAQISCVSKNAVVDVEDSILVWAREGIFSLSRNQYGHIIIENLTRNKIQKDYNLIADDNKKEALAYYDILKGKVRWLYNSGDATIRSLLVPPKENVWWGLDVTLRDRRFVNLSDKTVLVGACELNSISKSVIITLYDKGPKDNGRVSVTKVADYIPRLENDITPLVIALPDGKRIATYQEQYSPTAKNLCTWTWNTATAKWELENTYNLQGTIPVVFYHSYLASQHFKDDIYLIGARSVYNSYIYTIKFDGDTAPILIDSVLLGSTFGFHKISKLGETGHFLTFTSTIGKVIKLNSDGTIASVSTKVFSANPDAPFASNSNRAISKIAIDQNGSNYVYVIGVIDTGASPYQHIGLYSWRYVYNPSSMTFSTDPSYRVEFWSDNPQGVPFTWPSTSYQQHNVIDGRVFLYFSAHNEVPPKAPVIGEIPTNGVVPFAGNLAVNWKEVRDGEVYTLNTTYTSMTTYANFLRGGDALWKAYDGRIVFADGYGRLSVSDNYYTNVSWENIDDI